MKELTVRPGFLKNWKKLKKKRYDKSELNEIVDILKNDEYIPAKYHDHALSGNYKGYRECHIRSNWLLIYESTDTEIVLIATGTYDDLFK